MKIAVTTPTGNIGNKLAHELRGAGKHELVLLARNPNKLKDLQGRGVTIQVGSIGDAKFVKRATAGVDTLFFLIPPHLPAEDYREYQKELTEVGVEAVRENEIKHTVLLSSFGAHLQEKTGPILGLHHAEKAFRGVTKSLTILRPGWFMENFLWQADSIKNTGSIFLPVPGTVSLPMIATKDIAAAAAEAIMGEKPTDPKTVSLHGPRDYTFDEVAGILGSALGKQVKHVCVPPEQAKEAMVGMGASENTAGVLLEMYASFTEGFIKDEAERSPETTTATTLEDFANSVVLPALSE